MATLDQAIAHGHRLLGAKPELAVRQAEEILRKYPNEARALRLLSFSRRRAGDDKGAAKAERQAIAAASRDPVLIEAAKALGEKQFPKAEQILLARLKTDPLDTAAMQLLAELAAKVGRFGDAESVLRRTLQLSPNFVEARAGLAAAVHRQGRSAEAIPFLEELRDSGDLRESHQILYASCLTRIGRYDDAIAMYRTVLKKRKEPRIWMSLGHALKTVGKQDESIAAYRRSLAQSPSLGEAWWSLANLKTVRFDDSDRKAMEDALALPDLDEDSRLHLHFALGKHLEDLGEAEQAWSHYSLGNAIRARQSPYDSELESRVIDRTIALMDGPFFAARAGQGCPDDDPIFIVGMPRAGSTLIEQILASHSQVEGTSELPDISAIAHSIGDRRSNDEADNYPANIAALDATALRALGERYLADTRIHRVRGKPRFIDKMPNNWLHVGLIRLILPNARIIDARRGPLDCGFSNFKQHFARGQNFAYDLTTIGRYYADYVRLMDHFDQVQPGQVHRVIHERLVDDPEAEVRALLAFCGLDYEPGCLRFHENKRAVRTASSEQVRQPLSRSGFDRWRPFERWLDPLKQALGPALETWDSPSP